MKPEIRPISVTIVDLMGAFLPGTVWLVLLLTFGKQLYTLFVSKDFTANITPISVTLELIANQNISLYVVLLVCSLIIGYSIKPLAMVVAERFCALFPYLWYSWYLKKNDSSLKEFRFPFDKEHKGKDYYTHIKDKVIEMLGLEQSKEFEKTLPKGTQPFSSCRRILRVLNPSLWEEVENREASVRLLGSLLLSAIFSLICAFISLKINILYFASIIWILTSLFALVFLAISYRRSRNAEVAYTYLNFIVATNVKPDTKESSSQNKS